VRTRHSVDLINLINLINFDQLRSAPVLGGASAASHTAQLGQLQCRPISSQIGVLPPTPPRSATNTGWPRWPTCPQAAQRGARQSVAAMTPVSEKHGLHYVGPLGHLQCRPISPQIGILPPPPPRSATNKGWPTWPTCPQAAQSGARQSVFAMTPVSEQHGLHWLAHLAIFSVGDVSPLARVLPPPPPRSAANKGWPTWPSFSVGDVSPKLASCDFHCRC
jgi:hypothetical protein